MISDTTYESCLPALSNADLDEEERTQEIESILKRELDLTGQTLEDAVLDVLWRHRATKNPKKSNPPMRPTLARSNSPTPWQYGFRPSTPSGAGSPGIGRASPAPRSSFSGSPAPAFIRSKSFGTSSPFSSPRPSPRLAFAAPVVPHSPTLDTYESSDGVPATIDYGDQGSDTVDWLVSEEFSSRPSSSGAGSISETTLNAAAAPWIQPQANEMSSYDILRSVMGDGKSDGDIEAALEASGFDLSSAIASLMGSSNVNAEQNLYSDNNGQVLIGKSMVTASSALLDSANSDRSPILCKYWLASGTCLRADCRFSHDLSGHVCKYWLAGNCLSGASCMFSHDPALLMSRVNIGPENSTPKSSLLPPDPQIHDDSSFPTLQGKLQGIFAPSSTNQQVGTGRPGDSPAFHPFAGSPRRQFEPRSSGTISSFGGSGSRPTSRHRAPYLTQQGTIPLVDDSEAFPSLGAAGVKAQKKHHGKRGGHNHGHANKENSPSLISDIVRMASGPPSASARKGLIKAKPTTGSSAAAGAIPAPQHIPWLETGAKADQEYIKARQDAFKHGALRNKFLQSAAQAWNRNDARAAKALSLRGQSENDLMRKAHREAARVLYDSRNADAVGSPEIYVDLHGLHPDEAINFLEDKLVAQQKSGRIVYAITGTGHHSKNGKDKVGKAVRGFLAEWKYAFREFSAAGAEGMGGILGIDPASFDKSLVAGRGREGKGEEDGGPDSSTGGSAVSTKVMIVKAVDRESTDDQGSES